MAHSNLLGGDDVPVQPDGSSAEALGTSGNSDSGSDVVGALSRAELQSDSDATGTGERADVERDNAGSAPDLRPDRVRGVDGLQAPGTADSEIDQIASSSSGADDADDAPAEEPLV